MPEDGNPRKELCARDHQRHLTDGVPETEPEHDMTSNEASAREIVEEQEPDKIELAENTPNREFP